MENITAKVYFSVEEFAGKNCDSNTNYNVWQTAKHAIQYRVRNQIGKYKIFRIRDVFLPRSSNEK